MQSESGFTLIEILVALAILGVGLATVLIGLNVGGTANREASQRSVSLAIAESLLATNEDLNGPPFGQKSGMTINQYEWKVVTKPWPPGSKDVARLIGAYWVQITVTRLGQSVTLTTLTVGPAYNAK